jgi:hypothetical protein
MKPLIIHVAVSLALVVCSAGISQAHNGKTAYAIPLSGITIDGKLDDWPREMAIYPIAWVSPLFYKSTPPSGPEDLTASFRVGYDRGVNLLYLAIVVLDEEAVIHPEAPEFWNQDLCEVYVDADHSGGDNALLGEGAQPYVMVAGPGQFRRFADGNPALASGNTRTSGVKAAVLRVAHTIVYEWAIPLFESFPEKRFQIQPGTTIGFDVVVADADGSEYANWIAWTPTEGKGDNSTLLGDLMFVEDYRRLNVTLGPVVSVDYRDIGVLAGRITDRTGGTPIQGARVELLRSEKVVQGVAADSLGTYRQSTMKGTYTVRVSARGAREAVIRHGVEVTGEKETRVDLSLEDFGTCFYVDDDALDEGNGSRDHPFRTIQEAMDVTGEGDTVRVMAGVYRELVVLVSGVTLLGAGPNATVLDGEGKRGVVRIVNVDDVMLDGFAIVGGYGRERQSVTGEYEQPFGGMLLENARQTRISHNVIGGNTSLGSGGGIACFGGDSTVVIVHNLIVGNTAKASASMGVAPGGGGLYIGPWLWSRPVVHHNTVVYNEAAGDGGGILCEGSSPSLHDNIIVQNVNGGIASRSVRYVSPQEAGPGPRLVRNDVWNNLSYDYSGLTPGEGDVSADPDFLAPERGDFRLSRRSPGRKAGTAGPLGVDIERLQTGESVV